MDDTSTYLNCQQDKMDRKKQPRLLELISTLAHPWESMPLDFIASLPKIRDHSSILVIIDRFSKYEIVISTSKYCLSEEMLGCFSSL